MLISWTSSIVTILEFILVSVKRALSSVVFPEPVDPQTMAVARFSIRSQT